jgi:hypothetical protein
VEGNLNVAKRKTQRAPRNAGKFAGPTAEQDAIEKLAASASASKGHNSGVVDEEIERRNTLQIKAAMQDLNIIMSEAASKRGILGSFKKLAKKEGCDVDAIMYALKLEARAKTGGSSPIVSEHRAVGRILKYLESPLHHQFGLFEDAVATVDAASDGQSAEREATLAGEHAGLNGEPRSNNPHTPGSPEHFGWSNGHIIGADKLTDSFKNGTIPAPAGQPAH